MRRSTSGTPARRASCWTRRQRARGGRQFWFYNGGRPAAGAIIIDAPATDAAGDDLGGVQARRQRATSTGTPSTGGTTRRSRGSATRTCGRTASRSTIASSRSRSPDDQGYINGDGVLIYPGEDRLHPDQDRGVRRAGRHHPAGQFPPRPAGPSVPHAGANLGLSRSSTR